MKNKLAVIGSRSFKIYSLLKGELNLLEFSEIVSGGAQGADSLASLYGKENNIPVVVFLPDWKLYGKSAGMIRNKQIVDYCDELIAFWDGSSKGTLSAINLAKKQNKKVTIVKF